MYYRLELCASEKKKKKKKKKTAKYQTQPYPDQNGQNYAKIIVAWANYRCAKCARSSDHPRTLLKMCLSSLDCLRDDQQWHRQKIQSSGVFKDDACSPRWVLLIRLDLQK